MAILIKDDDAIKKIGRAGSIIYEIFKTIKHMDLKGMTASALNEQIDRMIRTSNAVPAFYNYRGFPKSCCISLNSEVVHGIPDERVIKDGDLVKIDVGVQSGGYIADAARTFAVGAISAEAKKLIAVTRKSLERGIEAAQQGRRISDISRAIQQTAEDNGFSVVRELTGHGVGQELHEDPMIPNFVSAGEDPVIRPGMVMALEPMINAGRSDVITGRNGWTIMTKDGSLSCHFEDTIAVLKKGNLNLTRVLEV
jgi:methionyl aminopeptidase